MSKPVTPRQLIDAEPRLTVKIKPLRKAWSAEARAAAAAARRKKGGGGGGGGGKAQYSDVEEAASDVNKKVNDAIKGLKDADSDWDNHHDSEVISAWSKDKATNDEIGKKMQKIAKDLGHDAISYRTEKGNTGGAHDTIHILDVDGAMFDIDD